MSKKTSCNQALRLLDKTGNRCWYCGRELNATNTTFDHVIPQSKGGSNSESNKVACCRSCNTSKGTSSLDTFRLRLGFKAAGCPFVFNEAQMGWIIGSFDNEFTNKAKSYIFFGEIA